MYIVEDILNGEERRGQSERGGCRALMVVVGEEGMDDGKKGDVRGCKGRSGKRPIPMHRQGERHLCSGSSHALEAVALNAVAFCLSGKASFLMRIESLILRADSLRTGTHSHLCWFPGAIHLNLGR